MDVALLGAEYIHRDPEDVPLWNEVIRYGLEVQRIPKMDEGLIDHPTFPQLLSPKRAALRWGAVRSARMFNLINDYNGPDMSADEWIDYRGYRDLGEDLVSMALTGHLTGARQNVSIRAFKSDQISTAFDAKGDRQAARCQPRQGI